MTIFDGRRRLRRALPIRESATRFEIRENVLLGGDPTEPISLPGLKVDTRVGRGANGEVFSARDELGRRVAIKVWFRKSTSGMVRAKAEASKLAAIGPHPLFVVVHYFGVAGGFPYVVMEHVSGMSAREWLADKDRGFSERYEIWIKYSRALHRVYKAGMVHGDPHVGNILLSEKTPDLPRFGRHWNVKLTDLGTSLIWNHRMDLVKRECRVLQETASRLLGHKDVAELLDVSNIREPNLILVALDMFARTMSVTWNLREYGFKDSLDPLLSRHLADEIVKTPIFRLRATMDRLASRLSWPSIWPFAENISIALRKQRFDDPPPLPPTDQEGVVALSCAEKEALLARLERSYGMWCRSHRADCLERTLSMHGGLTFSDFE